jgi:hypothetical protein
MIKIRWYGKWYWSVRKIVPFYVRLNEKCFFLGPLGINWW